MSISGRERHPVKETLIKSQNTFSRHSGVGQNPVKTIVYWMLVFTSMTIKILNQSFTNYINEKSHLPEGRWLYFTNTKEFSYIAILLSLE